MKPLEVAPLISISALVFGTAALFPILTNIL